MYFFHTNGVVSYEMVMEKKLQSKRPTKRLKNYLQQKGVEMLEVKKETVVSTMALSVLWYSLRTVNTGFSWPACSS